MNDPSQVDVISIDDYVKDYPRHIMMGQKVKDDQIYAQSPKHWGVPT